MKKWNVLVCATMTLLMAFCGKKRENSNEGKISTDGCPAEVKIGTQIWSRSNLEVVLFRNGERIPEAKSFEEWQTAATEHKPAWCYYGNDPQNGRKYGKLYNWYAVCDPRGLAPKGWHIPTDNEWTVLSDYLGGLENAGVKMKSKTGWSGVRTGSNTSCFTGFPGGFRYFSGYFVSAGNYGHWWSSTHAGNIYISWGRYMLNGEDVLGRERYYMSSGCSVRCVKD